MQWNEFEARRRLNMATAELEVYKKYTAEYRALLEKTSAEVERVRQEIHTKLQDAESAFLAGFVAGVGAALLSVAMVVLWSGS